jgi:hypothetical protein
MINDLLSVLAHSPYTQAVISNVHVFVDCFRFVLLFIVVLLLLICWLASLH